jgi:hypothetical protein
MESEQVSEGRRVGGTERVREAQRSARRCSTVRDRERYAIAP